MNVLDVLTGWIERQPKSARIMAVPVRLADFTPGSITLTPIKTGESYEPMDVQYLLIDITNIRRAADNGQPLTDKELGPVVGPFDSIDELEKDLRAPDSA